MSVYMHVCMMYVCLHVYIHACMHVCVCVCVYVCMYVFMCVCIMFVCSWTPPIMNAVSPDSAQVCPLWVTVMIVGHLFTFYENGRGKSQS